MRKFDLIFYCLFDFSIGFFKMVFAILMVSFSQWKFLNLGQDLSCWIFLVVKIFVTIIWRHNHFNSAFCSFVDAISTELRVWRHFSLLWSKFFVHRVRNFLVSRDLTFTQSCLPHIFQLYSFFFVISFPQYAFSNFTSFALLFTTFNPHKSKKFELKFNFQKILSKIF